MLLRKNLIHLDKCILSNDIMDYQVVAQGKTTIPGVDDAEEMQLTDVRTNWLRHLFCFFPFHIIKNDCTSLYSRID